MRLEATAVTKDSKTARDRTYWGVKHSDGNWYNLLIDQRPARGAVFEVEVKESSFNGKTYRWAEIKESSHKNGSANANGTNGYAATWEDYARMARAAHALASELEADVPKDQPDGVSFSCAQARASIVNTVIIAFSNGKVLLPQDDEPNPDGLPF